MIAPTSHRALSRYSSIDDQVKNIPPHLEHNLRSYPTAENLRALVNFLVNSSFSTERNAKILHDWVTINIFYDMDDYIQNIYSPNHYIQVLNRRLAECQGYTALFFKMAQLAGLRVATVQGAAANKHIWNAIFDNNQWMHVDTTWDAGSFSGGTLLPYYNTTYFYLTETEMSTVQTHLMDGGAYDYSELDGDAL